jgi:hypothetical protein
MFPLVPIANLLNLAGVFLRQIAHYDNRHRWSSSLCGPKGPGRPEGWEIHPRLARAGSIRVNIYDRVIVAQTRGFESKYSEHDLG